MTATSHPEHKINLIGTLLNDAFKAATCGSLVGWQAFENLCLAIVKCYPNEAISNKVHEVYFKATMMPRTKVPSEAYQLPVTKLIDELQEYRPEVETLRFLQNWLKQGYGYRQDDIIELSDKAVCDVDLLMTYQCHIWWNLHDAIKYNRSSKERGVAMRRLTMWLRQQR